jgi:hypothetical protein
MNEKEFSSWFMKRLKTLSKTETIEKRRALLEDTLFHTHAYARENKEKLKSCAFEDYKDQAFTAAGIRFSLQEMSTLEKLWKLQEK